MSDATSRDVDGPTGTRYSIVNGDRHVDEALSAISEKRRRLERERRAFEEFLRRLGAIDVEDGPPAGGVGGPMAIQGVAQGTGGGVRAVIAAYRETVLDVPHYAEEYGEPLGLHLGKEFGTEVADALFGNDRLTPQLRAALAGGGKKAIRRRETVADQIEAERERLRERRSQLAAIEREAEDALEGAEAIGFDALRDRYERMEGLRARAEDLLADRQASARALDDAVRWYLFQGIDANYPILADGVRLLSALEETERLLTAYLTSRA